MTKEEKIAVERQEITQFMKYFDNNALDFNDTQLLQKLQAHIERVFQLEIEEMGYRYDPNKDDSENTFILQFINDPTNYTRGSQGTVRRIEDGKLIMGKPTITYNIANLYRNLTNANREIRLKECKLIFKTVFHEIQHHRQELMTIQGISSNEALRYGRDMACMSGVLGKDWYSRDKDTGNYEAYTLENNANEVGYSQVIEIMGNADHEISNLRDIERGKYNVSRYKADIDAFDGETHYDSNGLQERDDVTVPILDSLICEKRKTNLLIFYPILQKEYNLDGTKKSAIELIKNMKGEIQDISQNPQLSNKEKEQLIKDGQDMYYELIYRQIEKCTPEQVAELVTQIGKDESKDILERISHYFQRQLENRLGQSASMANAQTKMGNYGFIPPFNNGTIEVEKDGKNVQMTFDDFIKTIEPSLLERKFIIPTGKEKGEMSAERFIERYFFKYLAQDGKVRLKDGTEIPAKQYIEQYALQMGELKKGYSPRKFIMDTMKSETPWRFHTENRERLEKYYCDKKQVLADLSEKVTVYDQNKANEEMKKKVSSHQRKMDWIKEFIKDYEATEENTAYAIRANCENENIDRVLQSIKLGKFIGDYDNNATFYKENQQFYIEKIIPAMARLLKEADNLTIDGGTNYLEQFANLPEVNSILLQIKKSEQFREMHTKAEENRSNGNLPGYHRTPAEIDKQYAQEYLQSNNLSEGTVEQEIAYRRGLLYKSRIKIADDVDKKDIPKMRKQQISLTRVLARQEGKIPSKALYDSEKRMWYFHTDTRQNQKKLTPETIMSDTSMIGLQEINSVISETKQLQYQKTIPDKEESK